MTERMVYLDIVTDHIKISVAPLKDTPEAMSADAILLRMDKDDVLIIECNFLGLLHIPVKQYVITRKEVK